MGPVEIHSGNIPQHAVIRRNGQGTENVFAVHPDELDFSQLFIGEPAVSHFFRVTGDIEVHS